MAELLAVAKYLNKLHHDKYGYQMDQMKMHKMLYFLQRESLMISDRPLFDGDFEAWKYGPVLPGVRNEYITGNMFSGVYDVLSEHEAQLAKEVFDRYDSFSSWQLSALSHSESSWLAAREGLKMGESGRKKMNMSAISVDATREKLRRQGVVFA